MTSSPSIADLLLATLTSGRSTRRFYSILREREMKKLNKDSVSVALSRLHKKGLVNRSTTGWYVTAAGKNKMKDKKLLEHIPSPFKDNTLDTTIVSFDIPERDRIIRNWLRDQIKIFGYKMLQQSLWIGPGPLPQSFMKRLEKLKIRKRVKIFSRVKKTT